MLSLSSDHEVSINTFLRNYKWINGWKFGELFFVKDNNIKIDIDTDIDSDIPKQ